MLGNEGLARRLPELQFITVADFEGGARMSSEFHDVLRWYWVYSLLQQYPKLRGTHAACVCLWALFKSRLVLQRYASTSSIILAELRSLSIRVCAPFVPSA